LVADAPLVGFDVLEIYLSRVARLEVSTDEHEWLQSRNEQFVIGIVNRKVDRSFFQAAADTGWV